MIEKDTKNSLTLRARKSSSVSISRALSSGVIFRCGSGSKLGEYCNCATTQSQKALNEMSAIQNSFDHANVK